MARIIGGLVAVALLAVAVPSAWATPLPPGGTVSGSASGNVLPTYTGTVTASVPFQNASFAFQSQSGENIGFVSSAVVKSASGGLDFIYQVNVSLGRITGLAIGSFGNITTDVFQTLDNSNLHNTNQYFPGNVSVASYDRSSGTGNTIDVAFSGSGVGAEQASFLVIVHTNSSSYTLSQLKVTSMGQFLGIQTLAPVPEPATILLWTVTLVGFAGFIGCRKLRRHKAVPSAG
jgi:hypothetical protein